MCRVVTKVVRNSASTREADTATRASEPQRPDPLAGERLEIRRSSQGSATVETSRSPISRRGNRVAAGLGLSVLGALGGGMGCHVHDEWCARNVLREFSGAEDGRRKTEDAAALTPSLPMATV